jgi:hypothetical protein
MTHIHISWATWISIVIVVGVVAFIMNEIRRQRTANGWVPERKMTPFIAVSFLISALIISMAIRSLAHAN